MNKIKKSQIRAFRHFVDSHTNFFIAGHKEPDGDSVACCFALAAILKYYKKTYKLISAGPFRRTEIADAEHCFTNKVPFMTEADKKESALILCDCSEHKRIGELDANCENELKTLDLFIIDHHKTCDKGLDKNAIIDSSAPAASLLVQQLYEATVGVPSKQMAEVLFFGIMTDTGFFRYLTERDSEVFPQVERLVKAGASPRVIAQAIESGKPFDTRKLLGAVLSGTKQYLNGKLLVACEKLSDTSLYGTLGRDNDALYSILLSTKGVEAVAFIRQETESNCTIGLRSKDALDVSVVATHLGGGGHKNASGGSVSGTIDTLVPVIVKEFAKLIK